MVEQTPRYRDVETQLREFQRRLASLEGGILETPSFAATPHQLLAAIETMQLGVTIADKSGVVLYANPAQAKMYGVDTPDEIIGKDVSIFCLSGYRDRLTPKRLGEMKSWRRESVNIRKDGSAFPVHLLSDVVRGPDGEPIGVITTCEDLTEVKLAETERDRLRLQVRHSDTLENLGAMTSKLARDFQDMLEIVVRNTGPFLEDLPLDSEQVRDRVLEVDSAVTRMATLTDQLLAYSGQGGMLALDLNDRLRGMLRLFEASVDRNVRFRYRFLEQLPSITADPVEVDHVVRQLIANASEAFEGRPGEIRVQTEARYLNSADLDACQVRGDTTPGSYVLLEVSDDGPGMDPEVANRIFDPFYSTRSSSGGLGLAATAAIMRHHHGAISVSTHPGEGTSFRLFFPVAPRTAATGAAGPEATTPEGMKPDATTPEAMTSEATTLEATTPEVAAPEGMTPEATTLEARTLEATTTEVTAREAKTPEATTAEAVSKDASPSKPRGVASDQGGWPTWFPVSFGKPCPCCGNTTYRIRTAWYARPIRFFLRRYSSTRECFDCSWKGFTFHRG